jgi:uncharacterized lipoprotein YajG
MKKKQILMVIILAGVVLFAGCYTKKKGIVPCPGSYFEMKTTTPESIAIRNA